MKRRKSSTTNDQEEPSTSRRRPTVERPVKKGREIEADRSSSRQRSRDDEPSAPTRKDDRELDRGRRSTEERKPMPLKLKPKNIESPRPGRRSNIEDDSLWRSKDDEPTTSGWRADPDNDPSTSSKKQVEASIWGRRKADEEKLKRMADRKNAFLNKKKLLNEPINIPNIPLPVKKPAAVASTSAAALPQAESASAPPPEPPAPSGPYSLGRALKLTYKDFTEDSTIHGLSYVRLHRPYKEKIFWVLMMLLALIIFLNLIHTQYTKWKNTPVIVSLSEREVLVSEIPFPAVTICTEDKYVKTDTLNFGVFHYKYLQNYSSKSGPFHKPHEVSEEDFKKIRALMHVCGNYLVEGVTWSKMHHVHVLNYLKKIAPPFNKIFPFCMYRKKVRDCKSFFLRVYTEEGVCYTFNSLNATEMFREGTYQHHHFLWENHPLREEELNWDINGGYLDPDDFTTFPERVIGSGIEAGMLIVLQGFPENADAICRGPVQGFKINFHSPDEMPQVDRSFFLVSYDEDVLLMISPEMTYTTANAEDYEPERRKCYFRDERYLQFFQYYTQNNCEIECITNYTHDRCGCVQFSMPRLRTTRVCDVSNITCYDRAETEYLQNEFTSKGDDRKRCNCLPGCWEINYNVDVSQTHFHMPKMLSNVQLPEGFKSYEGNVSRVTVYFRKNEFLAFRRTQFYGFTELLAQGGGLFGVLMGGTAINLFEMFYIWIVRLIHYLRFQRI